jgi:HSP20 family molecular chaperone IbpA
MAPLDQLLFHSSAIRPEHVTLAQPHYTLRSIVNTLEDPYFSRHHPKSPNSFSPRFDVCESDTAFFLEGEFPGIERKEDIVIEKLGPRTLLVQAVNHRFNVGQEWNLPGSVGIVNDSAETQKQGGPVAPKPVISGGRERNGEVELKHAPDEGKIERDEDGLQVRLAERRIGDLQRSFTFPSAVEIEALKARLRHGLLVMMVPKVGGTKEDSRRIYIEE